MTLKHPISKTLGPKAAYLVTTLYERGRPIFRLKDVQKVLGLDKNASINFVRKLVNRGVVTRLKPGLFILVPFELGKERDYLGEPAVVAREIVAGKGYYLSHGTAMEIHQMVTQPQLVVYTSVLKPRRRILNKLKVVLKKTRFFENFSRGFSVVRFCFDRESKTQSRKKVLECFEFGISLFGKHAVDMFSADMAQARESSHPRVRLDDIF